MKTLAGTQKLRLPRMLLKAAILLLIAYTISRAMFSVLNYVAAHLTDARFKEIELAIYLYQMRYQRLPGDDNLQHQFHPLQSAGPQPVGGNANSMIEFGTGPNAESALVWQHLRRSGLIGSISAEAQPLRVFPNGEFAVFSDTIYGSYGTYVCAHNLSNSVIINLLGYTSKSNARTRRYIWVARSEYPASAAIPRSSNNGQIICTRLYW